MTTYNHSSSYNRTFERKVIEVNFKLKQYSYKIFFLILIKQLSFTLN